MNEEVKISPQQSPEGIDLNKLRIIFRNNLLWMIVIFITANACAYLYIRYTKNVYESVSEIKLDIKQEASEFGLRDFANNQDLKMVSGEIENIKSKSFLSSIIDSLDINVSYFSIGQLQNTELYHVSPFIVEYKAKSSRYFDTPFRVDPVGASEYRITPVSGSEIHGTFGQKLELDDLTLTLTKSEKIDFEKANIYSFTINSRPALLNYLMTNLAAAPLNLNANTIQVSFSDNTPLKAHTLVNRIDSLYLQYSYDQKNRANRQKIEWLTSELAQIEKKMESFEDYFEDFTLKNKTYDMEEDLKKTVSSIHDIDSQRYEVSIRIQEVNRALQSIDMAGAEPTLLQSANMPTSIAMGIKELQDLYMEMNKMKLSYNESTIAYRKKESEIKNVREKVRDQLEDYKRRLLASMQQLSSSKSKLEIAFATMPDKNTQFSKNQRYYKLYEEFYLTLMQNKSEFEIAQAGSTPEFKILSAATLPAEPISPNKPIIYGIGFVAGLTICVFFLGLLYIVNNKVTSINELELVQGIPALGTIPVLGKRSEHDLHIIEHPRSMVSEAFRSLRTNLDFINSNDKNRVIAISSTISGEGKSFIAENLGAALAQSHKKVVLIDLDMRKTHRVNISKQPKDQSMGVSSILIKKADWKDCVINTTQDGFDFIPAGTQPPNPAELILNGAFTEFLADLKKHYDVIMLDTPPVGLVADGIMAMKQSDVSVYVFRANYSKREFMHNLRRLVNLNRLSSVTTVLNAMPVSIDSYGYGYYDDQPNGNPLKFLFKKRA